jgi:hypothetical protein
MLKKTALSMALFVTALSMGCSVQPGSAPTNGAATGGAAPATGTTAGVGSTAVESGEVFNSLPPGDMLMTMDLGTAMNQIPTILAKMPEQQREFEAELRDFQTKTGIDPKQLKLAAFTAKFPKGTAQAEIAAIVTGSWDAARLRDQIKATPGTREETHEGQAIYIKTENNQETGIAIIDGSSMIFGSPAAMVRASIDARLKKGPAAGANAELMSAFQSTKKAVARFATSIPREVLQQQGR